MASNPNVDDKKSITLMEVLPMLKGDLRMVVDYSCKEHGRPGPGPNFTAAMLCLVACEVVGRLSSDVEDDEQATKEFLSRISEVTGDVRYKRQAKNIITIFRHGIVHSFLPKQHVKARGKVSWVTWLPPLEGGVCVDWLSSAEGAALLGNLRRTHLCFEKKIRDKKDRRFVLQPQVFYVDLMKTVKRFEDDLRSNDRETIQKFDVGFERWWEGASSISPLRKKKKQETYESKNR